MSITNKGKVGQFLCSHRNQGWYKEEEDADKLVNISGETHYKVCEDCGKILGQQFVEYEEVGFK